MKVGDYVRYVDIFNNTIKIRKINEIIPPDKLIKKDVYFFNNKECSLKENIIKSSPNIIDLIEVGDYVNEHKVLDIYKDINGKVRMKFGENDLVLVYKSNYDNYYLFEEDIKSIVTREQFSQIEYKVKE